MLLSTQLSLCRAASQLRLLRNVSYLPRESGLYSTSVLNPQQIFSNSPRRDYPPDVATPKLQVTSSWHTLHDQPLTRGALWNLLNNMIPSIRHKGFLTSEECHKAVEVIQSHKIVSSTIWCFISPQLMMQGSYDLKMVFPRVGSVGITQFDNRFGK
jgi:hypothetical protein